MDPLLVASDVRVDVEGVPALDGLSLATTGARVMVLGSARALFEAASGLRPACRGELRVHGLEPAMAARANLAACAPLDPPMPPRWTVLAYVTWSARLAGHSRRGAGRHVEEALDRTQTRASAQTRLRAATPALRRATVLAAALATGAPTLLVDDLATGLPDETARLFVRRVARALEGRRAMLFAARVPLESPLALASDEALVLDGSDVVAQGAPAELASAERVVAVRVEGDAASFARAIEERGGHARVGASVLGLSTRVRVELGTLEARDLLGIASGVQAVVVELCPVARAFA